MTTALLKAKKADESCFADLFQYFHEILRRARRREITPIPPENTIITVVQRRAVNFQHKQSSVQHVSDITLPTDTCSKQWEDEAVEWEGEKERENKQISYSLLCLSPFLAPKAYLAFLCYRLLGRGRRLFQWIIHC